MFIPPVEVLVEVLVDVDVEVLVDVVGSVVDEVVVVEVLVVVGSVVVLVVVVVVVVVPSLAEVTSLESLSLPLDPEIPPLDDDEVSSVVPAEAVWEAVWVAG